MSCHVVPASLANAPICARQPVAAGQALHLTERQRRASRSRALGGGTGRCRRAAPSDQSSAQLACPCPTAHLGTQNHAPTCGELTRHIPISDHQASTTHTATHHLARAAPAYCLGNASHSSLHKRWPCNKATATTHMLQLPLSTRPLHPNISSSSAVRAQWAATAVLLPAHSAVARTSMLSMRTCGGAGCVCHA